MIEHWNQTPRQDIAKFTCFPHVSSCQRGSFDLHQGASIEDPLFEGVQEECLHLGGSKHVRTIPAKKNGRTEPFGVPSILLLGAEESSLGSSSKECLSCPNVQFGMVHQMFFKLVTEGDIAQLLPLSSQALGHLAICICWRRHRHMAPGAKQADEVWHRLVPQGWWAMEKQTRV